MDPNDAPVRPPKMRIIPILRSTALRLKCAKTPDKEDATIWFASVATAMQVDTTKNNKGVWRSHRLRQTSPKVCQLLNRAQSTEICLPKLRL